MPKSEWESWENEGTTSISTKFYPADYEISLTIKNNSDTTIEEFLVQVNREDSKIFRGVSLPPKKATTVNIPMTGYKLQSIGAFIWLSFEMVKPHLKHQSFSYSVWINPEDEE